MGAPGVARSTREDQHLFVNRRPVENRGLNFALIEGYHTALMKGRYPVCCLFLEVDPATVDVNIHPAKREVKFHNERAVRQLTAQAVRETLLKFHGATAPAASDPPIPASSDEVRRVRAPSPAPPAAPAASTGELPSFTPFTGTPLAAFPKPPAGSEPRWAPDSAPPARLR